MDLPNLQIETCKIEVDRIDRWLVYQRLLELEIPCECAFNQPLEVEVNSVTTAIQLWSVVRCLSAPRQTLVCDLKRCWQAEL